MGGCPVKVLSVASECAPLVKTGGLADVVGALPAALAGQGVEMRVLLPGYRPVLGAVGKGKKLVDLPDFFGGKAVLRAGQAAGLDLIVLDAPHLFDREGTPYLDPANHDWPDNPERFAALSWAACLVAAGEAGTWRPDVVHAHDWQAGFAPYYLKAHFGAPVPSVLTIHNIAFHGVVPVDRMANLRIEAKDYDREGVEFWGQISALKAGLVYADRLTTVSPTYARELTRAEFGMGMDGVIRSRDADFVGILNGIDEEVWDPASDPQITAYKSAKGKARNKAALRKEFGLGEAEGPLCVVVSRLSDQKGLDLLLQALPALIDRGGQLALLGSGDPGLEVAFTHAAEAHDNIAVKIGYDEGLSHRMMAGGDAILVPSRFEPCGLTQLYGLRYGTVPVVALTGGLADTVIPASPAAIEAGVATGIQFHPVTADALAHALMQLVDLYHRPEDWARLQKNGMAQNVGWARSAAKYAEVYGELVAAA
ncbi:glycogen synthase GlgA [Aestuariibius sp. 2305UL40-4]|uniref:glycogen synthase GlgA n=1 Tax=Aestuariibius violaceus TaxID=3234132 RepID=UPI00345EC535